MHTLKSINIITALTVMSLAASAGPITSNAPTAKAGQQTSQKATSKPKHHRRAKDADEASERPGGASTVSYHHGDVIHLRVKRHFVSAVQIEKEEVMKIEGGDNEHWQADLQKNVIVVRAKDGANAPKADSQTSLIATTTSGNLYLIGIDLSSGAYDTLITVHPADAEMKAAAAAPPKFVPAEVAEGLKTELASANQQLKEIQDDANRRVADAEAKGKEEIEKFRTEYPTKMQFGYKYKAHKSPFYVDSVWHDEHFTYIRADPDEVCAVYAEKDGKPMLVDAPYRDGQYTIPMVLYGDFYLRAGKKKFMIERRDK